ncbi:hypothetical protein [Pseudothermotoga elfii]
MERSADKDKFVSIYPEEIILKIPENLVSEIEEIRRQLQEYDPNNNKVSQAWKNWKNSFIVHFDNHLYTPLIIWKKLNQYPSN